MRRLNVKLDTFHIEVRRDHVLKDALKEAGKSKFDAQKTMKVITYTHYVHGTCIVVCTIDVVS